MRRLSFRKTLCFLLIAAMLLPVLVACSADPAEGELAVKWRRGVIASDSHESGEVGLITRVDGYSYTDVITIPEKGTRITFIDNNAEGLVDVDFAEDDVLVISHWIKEDGEWILEDPGDNYTGVGGRAEEVVKRGKNSVIYSYVTSYDNESIRLCYRSGQTAFNKSKIVFPAVTAEVTGEMGTLQTSDTDIAKQILVRRFLKTSPSEQWYEELKGVTLYAMGDSYFGGSKNGVEYVWPNLMAQKYEMSFINYGIGGSSVCNQGHKPMCNRISEMTVGTPDIILLEGGRNDFVGGFALGDVDSTDPSTFCGGINSCIDQLQAKYPDALIIGITCWAYDATNKQGDQQVDFGNAMIEVCAARGLPCFNAMDKSVTGVDMDSKAFRSKYSQDSGDVSHLNTLGMILVEATFEKFIAEQYKIFKAS